MSRSAFNKSLWNMQTRMIALLIVLSFVFGIYAGYTVDDDLKYDSLKQVFSYIDEATGNSQGFSLSTLIFLNNVEVAALLLLIGLTILGPFFVMFANGVVIALVDTIVKRALGLFGITDSLFTLKGIIVHGIPELLAIFMAATLGVYLGIKFWQFLFSAYSYMFKKDFISFRRKAKALKDTVLRIIPVFVLLIIPLLILASLLEVFVSPLLIGYAIPTNIDNTGIVSHNNMESLLQEHDHMINLSSCESSSKSFAKSHLMMTSLIRDDYYNTFDKLINEDHNAKDYRLITFTELNGSIAIEYEYDFSDFIEHYELEINFTYDNFTEIFNGSSIISSNDFVCNNTDIYVEVRIKE